MSEVKFEGQVALVTGASRGIGAAIALELAQKGLKVIGTATSDEGREIGSQIGAFLPGDEFGEVESVGADVTDGAAGARAGGVCAPVGLFLPRGLKVGG